MPYGVVMLGTAMSFTQGYRCNFRSSPLYVGDRWGIVFTAIGGEFLGDVLGEAIPKFMVRFFFIGLFVVLCCVCALIFGLYCM